MRKFSTYSGLYTKTPFISPKTATTDRVCPSAPQTMEETVVSENIPPAQLSPKALKCYSAIKQHDELVKALLNKD